MSKTRVAVVTGGNRGIGLAIVRGLCKRFDGIVYLTARDEKRGQEAVDNLKEELKEDAKSNLLFHQLNITDKESIVQLQRHLVEKHGGLDVLINNAGISYEWPPNQPSLPPFPERAERTMRVNFYGTLNMNETMMPILKPHARISTVSSSSGLLCLMRSQRRREEIARKVKDKSMTIEDLKAMADECVRDAKAGKWEESGWPVETYEMSKLLMTLMTFVQAEQLREDPREDIVMNCCCPGFVQTDMTSGLGASVTPDEGADTPLYLALLPPGTTSPTGQYLENRKIVDWCTKHINIDNYR